MTCEKKRKKTNENEREQTKHLRYTISGL